MEWSTMVDLETLATQPDAVILSIAAVKFDPWDDYAARGVGVSELPQLNLLLDIDTQTDRVVDPGTVDWWSKQDPVVQDSIFGDHPRVSLTDALDQLHRFLWNSSNRIWAQGTHFDIAILEHAFRSQKRAYPWQYWQARDSRTLLDLVSVPLPAATHDAVSDCYRQIVGVQKALAALSVTGFVR
jgi:3' exoribonuclease, RNase T-like